MSDKPTAGNQPGTPTAGSKPGATPTRGNEEKMFTQEELNSIVQGRISKYADYDDIKSKLEKVENANKSELEKVTERATAAEAKIAAYEKQEQISKLRMAIRKEKGIPETMDALLTGTTEDEIKTQADLIAENMPKTAKPIVKSDSGNNFSDGGDKKSALADFTAELIGE